MIRQTYEIEIITPCFCGGAEPDKQAEIRAASIRGQLRWWFRVLGGFKSLAPMSLREQEDMIFGSAAGDEGAAGKLIVRVTDIIPSIDVVDDEKMGATPGSDRGYLLFPLRPEKKGKPEERRRDRAVFNKLSSSQNPPTFSLQLLWRGPSTIARDIDALVTVFGNLGALGFRSRRAMGALNIRKAPAGLYDSLERFNSSKSVIIRTLPASNAADAITILAKWLQSWRSHGRSGMNQKEQGNPGFKLAKSDHDARHHNDPGYRAALGLPLLAKYGNWDQGLNERTRKGSGRFASPILLRPHRSENGAYCALVVFVEAMKWQRGQHAYFEGRRRLVSTDLYDLMKADSRLSTYA